jgi:hypothetical protein
LPSDNIARQSPVASARVRVDRQIDCDKKDADSYRRTVTWLRRIEYALALTATLITAVASVTGKSTHVSLELVDIAARTAVLTTIAGAVLARVEASRFRLPRNDLSCDCMPSRRSEEWFARTSVKLHQRLRGHHRDGESVLDRKMDLVRSNAAPAGTTHCVCIALKPVRAADDGSASSRRPTTDSRVSGRRRYPKER